MSIQELMLLLQQLLQRNGMQGGNPLGAGSAPMQGPSQGSTYLNRTFANPAPGAPANQPPPVSSTRSPANQPPASFSPPPSYMDAAPAPPKATPISPPMPPKAPPISPPSFGGFPAPPAMPLPQSQGIADMMLATMGQGSTPFSPPPVGTPPPQRTASYPRASAPAKRSSRR